MLTLHRAGTGLLHRMPPVPKLVLVVVAVVAVSALPATPVGAGIAAAGCLAAYAAAGVGDRMRTLPDLARQAWALRWLIVVMALGQLVFLGPEAALVNTVRVAAAVLLAGLLALTTAVSALLDGLEHVMRPLALIGVDPARAALTMIITVGTLPVLAGLARTVHEAQRARGARPGVRRFAVPMLVVALKHADELGEALAARGVR